MRKFVLPKKYWFLVIVLVAGVVVWYVQSAKDGFPEGVEVGMVGKGRVEEVVNETGFVKVSQTVDLAFQSGGQVKSILVDEGSFVDAGAVLIVLDGSRQGSDLSSAQARLDAERIRLEEMLAGADSASRAVTESSVALAETTLLNAKRNLVDVTAQQDQLLTNAEKTLRSSSLEAYLVSEENENSPFSYTAPTITGVYESDEEGLYRLELYDSNSPSGASVRIFGLESDTHPVSTVNPVAIGVRGLYMQFPDNFAKRTVWEIPVPNIRSSSYLTNLNTYNAVLEARNIALTNAESVVKTAEAGLIQARSQLIQISSSAREEKLVAQRAAVRQMEALVAQAQVAYSNTVITAPFAGVITSVATEVGQIVSSGIPAVSLNAHNGFEVVVDISEVDIAEISVGDHAVITFDAYDDKEFTAKVSKVAPNATLVSGVRVFAVTLLFDAENELIKDGLTAQIDITTATREGVIAIPTRSIYENDEGKFVRVITDRGEVVEQDVTTGLRGSNGMTEITSGLTEGVHIITFADEEAIAQIKEN